jgi:hypothetical protein
VLRKNGLQTNQETCKKTLERTVSVYHNTGVEYLSLLACGERKNIFSVRIKKSGLGVGYLLLVVLVLIGTYL